MIAKPATCRECRTKFVKVRALQVVCSPMCALESSRKQTEKKLAKLAAADKKATRVKLDALRTQPQLKALAQKAFNSFIRARDAGKQCISCNTELPAEAIGGAFDAGHYRSVGSAAHMRFVEDNCHGQCKHCNRYLAGNHVEYRKRLGLRIGQRALDLLEADQTLRKHTKEALIEIARYYNAEARKLKGLL